MYIYKKVVWFICGERRRDVGRDGENTLGTGVKFEQENTIGSEVGVLGVLSLSILVKRPKWEFANSLRVKRLIYPLFICAYDYQWQVQECGAQSGGPTHWAKAISCMFLLTQQQENGQAIWGH